MYRPVAALLLALPAAHPLAAPAPASDAARLRSLRGDDETTHARIGVQHEPDAHGWSIADA